MDQEVGDGGDSDNEGEECNIHEEAITRSILSRHDHSDDDYMACENISAGDIATQNTQVFVGDFLHTDTGN